MKWLHKAFWFMGSVSWRDLALFVATLQVSTLSVSHGRFFSGILIQVLAWIAFIAAERPPYKPLDQ